MVRPDAFDNPGPVADIGGWADAIGGAVAERLSDRGRLAGRWAAALDRFTISSRGVAPAFALSVAALALAAALLAPIVHTTGDTLIYGDFYSRLRGVDVHHLLFWQECLLTSREPVYALLAWTAANLGLSHAALMGALNATLVGLIAVWLWRNAAPWPTWILLYTNFYVLVVFASAERLKLAVLFLLAAVIVRATWQKVVLVVLGMGAHLQGIMLVGAWVFGRLPAFGARVDLRRDWRLLALAAALVVGLGAAFVAISWSHLVNKAARYMEASAGLIEGGDFLVLIAVGLLAGRDRLRVVLAQLPLLLLAFVLGNSRMTILGFFLLLEQLVEERRTGHPAFMALMAYLTYKSVGFVEAVAAVGNGFGSTRPYIPADYGACVAGLI